tara:strand:+ start:2090 stop:2851 length:762 start_codon:yes stop_codon:yes gene_type:complete
MNKIEKGFLYIAFGDAFTKEALMSIKSLKRYNNEPVALFTDSDKTDEFEGLVDIYGKIEPKHIRAKVDFISKTPFNKTVYLDSDTLIVRNISDMFDVLSRFDVALTNDYARKRTKYSKLVPEYKEIPYAFSEVNGGIMAYNDTQATQTFLAMWREYFYKYFKETNGWDQVSLRVALWRSNVRIHHFPFEYNIRSKGNREKQDRFKHEFGEQHMAPRIYHLHYENKDVHNGIFKYSLKDIKEYEALMIKQSVKY